METTTHPNDYVLDCYMGREPPFVQSETIDVLLGLKKTQNILIWRCKNIANAERQLKLFKEV